MSNESEGWGFPTSARKAHYFRDGRSLCGRYGWFVADNDRLEPDTKPSRDDCAGCRAKLPAAEGLTG